MIEKAIEALNAAFAADPKAMREIFAWSTGCNKTLADHPTVQVGDREGEYYVRVIGILNGVIEPITGERIAMLYDDDKNFVGFVKFKP